MVQEKRCSRCKQIKPVSQFHQHNTATSGLQSQCKQCSSVSSKEYRKRRKEKQGVSWSNAKVQKKYGITLEEYLSLREKQKGKCLICKRRLPLQFDHCHSTGKYRGFLCRSCNQGLGLFRDDVKTLKKAIKYLLANRD